MTTVTFTGFVKFIHQTLNYHSDTSQKIFLSLNTIGKFKVENRKVHILLHVTENYIPSLRKEMIWADRNNNDGI